MKQLKKILSRVSCAIILMAMVVTMVPTNAKAANTPFYEVYDGVIYDGVGLDGRHEVLTKKVIELEGKKGNESVQEYYWTVEAKNNIPKMDFYLIRGETIHSKMSIFRPAEYGTREEAKYITLNNEGKYLNAGNYIRTIINDNETDYVISRSFSDDDEKPTYAVKYEAKTYEGKIRIRKEFLDDFIKLVPDENAYGKISFASGKGCVYFPCVAAKEKKELHMFVLKNGGITPVKDVEVSYDERDSISISPDFNYDEEYILLADNAKENFDKWHYGKIMSLFESRKSVNTFGSVTATNCELYSYGVKDKYSESGIYLNYDVADGRKIYTYGLMSDQIYYENQIVLQYTEKGVLALFSAGDEFGESNTKNYSLSTDNKGELNYFRNGYSLNDKETNNVATVDNFYYPNGTKKECASINGYKGTTVSKKLLKFIYDNIKNKNTNVDIAVEDENYHVFYKVKATAEALMKNKKLFLVKYDNDKYECVGSAKKRLNKDGSMPLNLTATKGQTYIFAENFDFDYMDAPYGSTLSYVYNLDSDANIILNTEGIADVVHNDGTVERLSKVTEREDFPEGSSITGFFTSDMMNYSYEKKDGSKKYILYQKHGEGITCEASHNFKYDGKKYLYSDTIYLDKDKNFDGATIALESEDSKEGITALKALDRNGEEVACILNITARRNKKNIVTVERAWIEQLMYHFEEENHDVDIYPTSDSIGRYCVHCNLNNLANGKKLKLYRLDNKTIKKVSDEVYSLGKKGNFKFKLSATKGQEYYLLTDKEAKEILKNPNKAWENRNNPVESMYEKKVTVSDVSDYYNDYKKTETTYFTKKIGKDTTWKVEKVEYEYSGGISEQYIVNWKRGDVLEGELLVIVLPSGDIQVVSFDDYYEEKIESGRKIGHEINARLRIKADGTFDKKTSQQRWFDDTESVYYYDTINNTLTVDSASYFSGKDLKDNCYFVRKDLIKELCKEASGNLRIGIYNKSEKVRVITFSNVMLEDKNLRLIKKVNGYYSLASYEIYDFDKNGELYFEINDMDEKAEYYLVTQKDAERLLNR